MLTKIFKYIVKIVDKRLYQFGSEGHPTTSMLSGSFGMAAQPKNLISVGIEASLFQS